MGRLQRWEVSEAWAFGDLRVHLVRHSAPSDRYYTLCGMHAEAPAVGSEPPPDDQFDCGSCWIEAARRHIDVRPRRPAAGNFAVHRVHVGPPAEAAVVNLSLLPASLRPVTKLAVDAGWVVDWSLTDVDAVLVRDRYGCLLFLEGRGGGLYRDEHGRDTELLDPEEVQRAIFHLPP